MQILSFNFNLPHIIFFYPLIFIEINPAHNHKLSHLMKSFLQEEVGNL